MHFTKDFLGIVYVLFVTCKQSWSTYTFIGVITLRYSIHSELGAKLGYFSGSLLRTLYMCVYLLAVISHLRSVITHPGPVPSLPKTNLTAHCNLCNQVKPKRAHHCKTCNTCVFKVRAKQMDHHCPLINNCVGAANFKFFLLAMFYTSLFTLYSAACLSFEASYEWSHKYSFKVLPCVVMAGAFALSIFFFVVTTAIGVEQWESVIRNQSYIEIHFKIAGEDRSMTRKLKDIFGMSSYLLPTSPMVRYDYDEATVERNEEPILGQATFKLLLTGGGLILGGIGLGLTS